MKWHTQETSHDLQRAWLTLPTPWYGLYVGCRFCLVLWLSGTTRAWVGSILSNCPRVMWGYDLFFFLFFFFCFWPLPVSPFLPSFFVFFCLSPFQPHRLHDTLIKTRSTCDLFFFTRDISASTLWYGFWDIDQIFLVSRMYGIPVVI